MKKQWIIACLIGIQGVNVQAVSYTHLDVYKRQTVSLPLQREIFEEDVQVEFILNDSQSSAPHPVDSMKALTGRISICLLSTTETAPVIDLLRTVQSGLFTSRFT